MNMTKKQRNLTFAVLLVSSIGTSLLQTALTTALPSMMRDLSISAATAQWLTSVYSLTVGIMVPATAYLIKRFPTRKLFLSAVTLFAAGTLLAIVTPTFSLLMVARVMQASNDSGSGPDYIPGGAKRNCDGNLWSGSRSSSCRGSYAGRHHH